MLHPLPSLLGTERTPLERRVGDLAAGTTCEAGIPPLIRTEEKVMEIQSAAPAMYALMIGPATDGSAALDGQPSIFGQITGPS